MTPFVRNFQTAQDGALTLTTGSDTQPGDLLYLIHFDSYGKTSEMTAPAASGGWSEFGSFSNSTHGAARGYYKYAAGGSETVTVTQSVNGRCIALYVLGSAKMGSIGSNGSNSYVRTQNAPAITTYKADSLVLHAWCCVSFSGSPTDSYGGASGDTRDGMLVFDNDFSFADFSHTLATTPGTVAAAPNTMSLSGGSNYLTQSVVIAPADLPALSGSANLNLSASGSIVPGIVGHAPLNLGTSHDIHAILTGEAFLALDAKGEIPAPPVDNTPNLEHLATLSLAETPSPVYRLCIAETLTGHVLADLPYAANPSWKTELDAAGTLSGVTVPLYPKLEDDVLGYLNDDYRYSLVWAYGDKILQVGILAGLTVDDTQTPPTVSLTTITIWEWFNKMRIVKTPGLSLTDPASNLSFSATATDPSNQNLSWGSVARRLIENDMSTYDSNSFPINLPTPVSGNATIDYAASDGKQVGQAISDIVALDNPPEILFDPVWDDQAQTYFSWNMIAVDGRIGQLGFPHVWDYQEACQSIKITRDPSQMTFQDYEKGADNRSAGGTGTLSWSKSDYVPDKTAQGWPNIITFGTSHSSETKNDVLYSYANANVRTNQNPVFTAEAVVRMDGKTSNGEQTGSPSVDQVAVGDTGYIQVRNHPFWPDGKYGARVLAIANGPDLWSAVLTLQILGATTL